MTIPARQQHGFTLIEIMLALVLGLILTGGAIYMFIANQQTYSMASALGRMQEAGRVALNLVVDDLHMAGFMGCAAGRASAQGNSSMTGGMVTDCRTGEPCESGNVQLNAYGVAATDADGDGTAETLSIRYATGSAGLATTEPDGNNTLTFANTTRLQSGDEAVLSSCSGAYLFTVGGVSADQLTITPTNASFVTDSFVKSDPRMLRFVERHYWVGPTGDTTAAGDTIQALYRSPAPDNDLTPDGNDVELVRGVGYMHAQFGTIASCANGQPAAWRYRDWDQFVGATNAQLRQIASVRIGFLVHSADRVRTQPDQTTYVVAGQAVAPPGAAGSGPRYTVDERIHSVFVTTVLLRNRVRCFQSAGGTT